MNAAAAGEVLLLRAFETSDSASWSDEDRAWATRSALQAVGSDAPAERFLAARAAAALGRLETREPLLARWRALRPWRGAWAGLLAAAALLLGLLIDHIGSAQRINLLAPPVWGLIVWNLVVYASLPFGSASGGALRRVLAGLWQRWRARALPADAAPAWTRFAADWAGASAPLQAARLAWLLHLGAAALGLGVLAGMYLRGLVLDYRVGWESTFLDAAQVRALLSVLLAPALALSGRALPDIDDAPAAPWIHLYALQVGLLVLLPRLLLALASWRRAAALQRELPLPMQQPYFQQLLRQQQGGHTRLLLWPHARMPDAAAQAVLQALCARVFGAAARLRIEAVVPYGDEDAVSAPAADGARCIACFDAGATPERESQGRLLQALAGSQAMPVLALVDEAAFVQRFGADSPRREERRRAWLALAQDAGAVGVFVELRAERLAQAEAALQAAL